MQERSYTDWIAYPHARLRFDLEKERGTPTRFFIQLEYHVGDEWRPVAHFDHNPKGAHGHDVTEDGLHMDIYREGTQVRTKTDFPPMPLSHAPDYCVSYFKTNADPLLRRFEQWHNLTTDR